MDSPSSFQYILRFVALEIILQKLPTWKANLPMIATYSRIAAGACLMAVILLKLPAANVWAAIIFVLGSLTDWLDGHLARKFQVESTMGKLMDPIADKILVLSALIILLDLKMVDSVMVVLLLSRDIFIGGIRSVAAANNVIIAAKPFGKWKTAIQMACVPMLFLADTFQAWPLSTIGYYGLWMSVGLSALSGVQYTVGYAKGRKTI